jgi:hypothetical protein
MRIRWVHSGGVDLMILGVEEASRPVALIDPYDITKKVALLVCIAEYDNTSLDFGQLIGRSSTCKGYGM